MNTSRLIPQFRDAKPLSQLSPEEEADLVRKAQAGDAEAKERLCAGIYKMLCKIAHQNCGKGLLWEDIVSEIYLKLLARLDKIIQGRYRVAVYAYLVARESLDCMRRNIASFHAKTYRVQRYETIRITRDQSICNHIDCNEVFSLLRDRLSIADWRLLADRYGIEGEAIPTESVMLRLGITEKQVWNRTHKALVKARKILETTGY